MSRPIRRQLRLLYLVGLLALSLLTSAAFAVPAAEARSNHHSSSYIEGIDVSHWQGTINWSKVAGSGKQFAFIKATEGYGYVDPNYASNIAGARAAGVVAGAYHYARPDLGNAPKDEADWFLDHTNFASGDLLPVLDLEVSGTLSVTQLQQWVSDWLNEVHNVTGRWAIIYTSPSFWQTSMGDTDQFAANDPLWIANWRVSSPSVPAGNWAGNGWSFWQYSDSGHVQGISGSVDLDRASGSDLTPFLFG
jgi:GH25 family lysozyme M1 (1,4-beta-N-acetylmuramidase)